MVQGVVVPDRLIVGGVDNVETVPITTTTTTAAAASDATTAAAAPIPIPTQHKY